ncbi:FliI/YscN family ATPase [Aurantiacibacter luteus]|uniref:Flagellum-specific ATP synthase n=1 Tax=Aurantiacibacter luteus TaxID=1581420 RepID=A0A0G9MKX9_9SPHN|nr:FliI/YscN family ATPase [Aurantiacibacter luteus]KLE31264.1 ATP synthase [Aurantiacibacter luteus]
MLSLAARTLEQLSRAPLSIGPVRHGRIRSCEGGLVEVSGLPVPIGTLCRIEDGAGSTEHTAEVIGFRHGHSLMMLLGDTVLLEPDSLVRPEGTPGMVEVSEAFLGRAVDGCAMPIDGGGPVAASTRWPLAGRREGALERASVTLPFDSGVRAINALATMGVGQRMGIIAGSGVGKSVLIDMIAHGAEADVVVVGLIGERAREVSDFVARHLSGAEAARTAIVAVPADHAPNLRLRGCQFATALAEFFRAQGKRVLLIMDSLTRVAHAAREIALLTGEPGAARGYPPSALATITRLVERAGNAASTGGAITGLYTVLADGDDTNDPVVDTARAILDGHLVLSRELAQRGHYPAIDVPASLSRIMDDVVTREQLAASRAMRALIADYEGNRDLVLMGAYREGADPAVDRAMAMHGPIAAFLAQERAERSSLADSRAQLLSVMQDGD